MVDPISAAVAVKEIDGAVGVIDRLLGRLRAQPDIAAAKLASALDEVVKTYAAVDRAISMYVSLAIDDAALRANSQALASLSGGALIVDVENGRGHCHEIYRIYSQHLDRWFARALDSSEYDEMRFAFLTLGDADDRLFQPLTEVANQLTGDVSVLVDLAIHDRIDDARAHVRDTYVSLRDVQRDISLGTARLYQLKDSVNDIAAR